MKKIYFLVTVLAGIASTGIAQISFTPANNVYTQNFNSLASQPNAPLPSQPNIRISTSGAPPRSVTNFTNAGLVAGPRAGNSMSATAPSGMYNFGAGDSIAATNRSVGGLIGGGIHNINLFTRFINGGLTSINSFEVSFDVLKFRNGTNPDGIAVQMFYSTDGSSWINAGSNFRSVVLGGDANNNGYVNAPQAAVNVTSDLPLIVSPNNDVYFAFNISIPTGMNTNNAAAVAIDNLSFTANYGNILPVRFSGFGAMLTNNGSVQLDWKTNSEQNVGAYEILKSQDGTNFKSLGTVKANNRPGTQEYRFYDTQITDATQYYRLRSVDLNGASFFSNIISIKGTRKTEVLVTPTVVDNGRFNVQINSLPVGKYQLTITNMNGQQLMSKTFENDGGVYTSMVNLPSSGASGYIIMNVIGQNYRYQTRLLVRK